MPVTSPGVPLGTFSDAQFDHDNLNFKNLNEIVNNGNEINDDYEKDNDFNQDFPRLNNFDSGDFDYYTISKFNSLCSKLNNSSLKVVHFNLRGINKNYDNLVVYLNSLDYSLDIICLSECHIKLGESDIDNRYNMIGYDKHIVYSSIKFGGCIIYSKTKYQAKLVEPLTKTTDSCDHLFIEIPKSKNNKRIIIGCYYRHCRKSKYDINKFIDDFENSLDSKLLRKCKIILTGDFNIDLFKVNVDNDVSTFFNSILSNNMECHILKPTRIQYYANSLQIRSATLIDQICSNLHEFNCTAGNLYYSNSDHFGNFVIFENVFNFKNYSKQTCEPIYRRNFSKIDNEKLVHDMNSIDWSSDVCCEDLDLNECTENLINHIQDLCDRHAPLVQISKRKLKYSHKPWINK